eukprot:Hpha_TRINITY_DN11306_c0_g1::TRINITY_DN11306_c0_g1_i1::g.63310::m.63310
MDGNDAKRRRVDEHSPLLTPPDDSRPAVVQCEVLDLPLGIEWSETAEELRRVLGAAAGAEADAAVQPVVRLVGVRVELACKPGEEARVSEHIGDRISFQGLQDLSPIVLPPLLPPDDEGAAALLEAQRQIAELRRQLEQARGGRERENRECPPSRESEHGRVE